MRSASAGCGLARSAEVHVVAGSSVYAWAATWDRVRPIRSDDVEESYHWSLWLMGHDVRTGFVRTPSGVSSTERADAALRQRARWTRGQLRAVAVNWSELPARGRILGAVTVGSLAARAALPVLAAGPLEGPTGRRLPGRLEPRGLGPQRAARAGDGLGRTAQRAQGAEAHAHRLPGQGRGQEGERGP
ncbi:glycosyltransferase family 2 protein [Streptomyces anatolicus]|uniref:glycosyltransferase family 2 protein n=1 Tax=Streptomyces anatolicus TaxID=2675858 RepID=UPI002155668E|nr:glycosyltransferase family 2 protein [Streptomyces anatolicus]